MTWSDNNTRPINKNRQRQYSKNAAPIGGILSDAIGRHGIGWQIKAAMAVKIANKILDDLIEPNLRNDIRAISFVSDQLTLSCRHAPASNLANSYRTQLQERLERELPNINIVNIFCKVDPYGLDSKSQIGV